MGNELNCTPGKRGGGERTGGVPSFFFLREFFCRALLSERLKQAKNLAIGQALFRSASTFVNSIEFSFHNLSNITFRSKKNCSGVTNSPLQAKKVVSKGKKEGKFTTNKKTRD